VRVAAAAALAAGLCALVACNDIHTFEGTWIGPRVGASPVLDLGIAPSATATLGIESIDSHGLQGAFSIDGLVDGAKVSSLAGAEADALAGMTFDGSPIRVYLSFVMLPDGNGEAFAVIALYGDKRVEVRVMRGGASPIYAIFALAEEP
jgi:hypothetical protein